MAGYDTQLDVINRAIQMLGRPRIFSTSELSPQAQEALFAYDKMRRYELRRNIWVFSIRSQALRALNGATQNVTFGTWASGSTYVQNDIVTGSDGQVWVSLAGSNTGNDPTQTFGKWTLYFGPMQASQYVAAFSGTQVYAVNQYALGSDGVTYISLVSNNLDNDPTVKPAAWSSLTTYASGNFVTGSDGNIYQSVTGSNLNHNPVGDGGVHWTLLVANTAGFTGWAPSTNINAGVSYFAGELVYVLNGSTVYLSTVSNNTLNPVGDTTGSWITMTTAPTLSKVNFIYPIGSGPQEESATRNVYILPNGYLRQAPQAPRAQANAFLGAPAGLAFPDWNFENGCFTSMDAQPIVFRFAADVADPSLFDAMFAEGLANRIAVAIFPYMEKSDVKKADLDKSYKKIMAEARIVNGIEIGSVDPPLDDYLTVRV